MKFLADTRDPRTGPALAKAFNEYEAGKNEDDVKYAAEGSEGWSRPSRLTDQNVKDALWNCFSKFQVSKTKMFNLVKGLHYAVVAVSDPSYGPKAVDQAPRRRLTRRTLTTCATSFSSGSSPPCRCSASFAFRAGREAARHRAPHSNT